MTIILEHIEVLYPCKKAMPKEFRKLNKKNRIMIFKIAKPPESLSPHTNVRSELPQKSNNSWQLAAKIPDVDAGNI